MIYKAVMQEERFRLMRKSELAYLGMESLKASCMHSSVRRASPRQGKPGFPQGQGLLLENSFLLYGEAGKVFCGTALSFYRNPSTTAL